MLARRPRAGRRAAPCRCGRRVKPASRIAREVALDLGASGERAPVARGGEGAVRDPAKVEALAADGEELAVDADPVVYVEGRSFSRMGSSARGMPRSAWRSAVVVRAAAGRAAGARADADALTLKPSVLSPPVNRRCAICPAPRWFNSPYPPKVSTYLESRNLPPTARALAMPGRSGALTGRRGALAGAERRRGLEAFRLGQGVSRAVPISPKSRPPTSRISSALLC